jgi:hypothetical protein
MSNESYIKLFFNSCDIIGSEIKLNYKGNTSIKTVFGGLMSLILILFTLFCISYFGADIIQREKPISRFYKEFTNQSIVNFTDFPVIMILTSGTGNPVPNIERYLEIDAVYYILSYDEKAKVQVSNRYSLFVEPCNEKHYYKYKDLIERKDSNVPLNVAYCINPYKVNYLNGTINDNDYIYALNDFGNIPSNFLIARVHSCINTTANNNSCASESEIDDSFFSAFYVDNYVNLNFYDVPNISFVNNYVQAITKGLCKGSHMKIKNTKILTDSGIILEDVSETSFHQLDTIYFDILSSGNNFLYLYIEATKMTDNYYRKYVKLQDLIANTGGLIKFLFTISSVILTVYTDKHKLVDISNSLFQVQRISMENESNTNLVRFESKMATPVGLVFANPLQQEKRQKHKNIDTSFKDYIKARFGCKSKYIISHYIGLNKLIENSLEMREVINSVLKMDKLVNKVFRNEG